MIEKLTFGLFNQDDSKNFMRLMQYAHPYKKRIALALVAIMGVAITESYFAAFISPLVNLGFAPPQPAPTNNTIGHWYDWLIHLKEHINHLIWGTENKIWAVPVFFLFLISIRGICRFASSYLLAWVGITVLGKLRHDMFSKMLALSSKEQSAMPSANISSSFLIQAEIAINNASNVFITLTRDTMIVIGLIGVLVYLNWQLSLVVLVMFPILSVLSRYYRDRLKNIQINAQAGYGDMTNVINETHQGHRVLKLFNGYDNAHRRFDFVNGKIIRMIKKMIQASSARSPFSELIASMALAVVIFIALWQSQTGSTTMGDFMAFIVAMLQMITPIKNLSNISIPMQAMFLASNSICDFLDKPNETDTGTQVLARAKGDIRFENVSVQYHDHAKKALDDFSLHIKSGEKIALVGRSGSGKTTAINLLPRFVESQLGKIYLDNININDLTLTSLRQQFALVSQDVFLFDDTLYNNVVYGHPDATEQEVENALKVANLWEFVQQQTDGWHQRIGMNGNHLSGGQRQRLSIARAIIKNAPILLLDEATSALDNESERLIQQALEQLMQHKTSIIVAHRLSTIEQADRIIVMDEGRIVEQGTHDELMQQRGHYSTLNNVNKSKKA